MHDAHVEYERNQIVRADSSTYLLVVIDGELTGMFGLDRDRTTTPLTPDRILKLAYAFREAKALMSAVELGVFDVLANGPVELDALRERTGIHVRGARDFFDALVALGLIDRDPDGRYVNTPGSDLYLVRGRPAYIGGLLDHLSTREYLHWHLLPRALKSGEPQFGSKEIEHYSKLYVDAATVESFAGAMSGGSFLVATALATKFPWRHYQTMIDVGAAEGCVPVQLAKAHPHLIAGGFDLPAVGPVFDRYVAEHGMSDRVTFYPGDFLTASLPVADVLVMGRVLHNWDLATKRMLLTKAFTALSPGGALIIYERLIDDERRASSTGLLGSLNMLVMTNGGFDFTGSDCIRWMGEAGFVGMQVEPLTRDHSMVIGVR